MGLRRAGARRRQRLDRLWNSNGWVARWNQAGQRFEDVPVLKELDSAGSFRRRDVWLLVGGRHHDAARRVEVAQTFFAGEFAGSTDAGFVCASIDGGRTWSLADRWDDEGPQDLLLSDDGRLTLLSWLGGIRQGTLTLNPLRTTMRTVLRGEDRHKAPYVQRSILVDCRIRSGADNLHPQAKGYDIWGAAVQAKLAQLMK